MAVTPLPTPDDQTAPTSEPRKTADLALVANTGAESENTNQADALTAPQEDAQPGQASEQAAGSRSTPAPAQTSSDDGARPGRLESVPTGAEAFTGDAAAAEPTDMHDAVTRPRLAAVRDAGDYVVPATARYAGNLTADALALRHQSIIRLGVASSTPRVALPTTPEQAAATDPSDTDHTNNPQQATTQPHATQPGTAVAGAAQASTTQTSAAVTGTADADTAQTNMAQAGTSQARRTADDGAAQAGTTRAATTVAGDVGSANVGSAKVAEAGASLGGFVAGVAGARPVRGVGRRVVREDLPGLPDARMWGGRLAQAVSEVLAGDRPISQLVRFTDDQVFVELNRRVRLLGLNSTAGSRGAKEKSTLRSVRVFMPDPSIAEVAAHVRHGDRSHAVALRLEIRRNRWVCTALELG